MAAIPPTRPGGLLPELFEVFGPEPDPPADVTAEEVRRQAAAGRPMTTAVDPASIWPAAGASAVSQGAQPSTQQPADSPTAPQKTRSRMLASLAGTMNKRGMAVEAIEAALLAENAAKCDPPLSEAKVRSIASDVVKRYPAGGSAAPAVASAPKPVVPSLSPDEAAILTGALLETCLRWIRQYVIVSAEQAVILALWVLHTYVMDACDWTPYLHITGPEKAVGKTLLMDALAAIACNPRTGSGASPAALVRIVDKYAPTLFLDEVDTITGGNKEMGEAVRGILDAGFKRGGVFLKCDGKDNEVRSFDVFGPKCFAGIGAMADTIESRSIPIEMRRKLRSERVERYRARVVAQLAAPIKAELEQWGAGVTAQLKTIVPTPIDALSDRANDVVEILLAIAQLAGGDWLQRLNAALLRVYGSAVADDTSTGVVLLTDIRNIFAEREAIHIPSKELTPALNEIEGRPWAEWSRGHGLSPNNLARLLSKYHIVPVTIRVAGETPKGYRKTDFAEAWDRYCGHSDFSNATPPQPASLLEETPFSNRNTKNDVAVQKTPETRMDIGLWRCGVSKPDIPAQESFSDVPTGQTDADEADPENRFHNVEV
jgi:hypothetical protein